ncbi:MAG: hypothetical protein V4729_09855 [Pseudomonadota bacterium]
MNKVLLLSCLLTAAFAHAETPPGVPVAPARPAAPAAPKPAPNAAGLKPAPAQPAAPAVPLPGQAVAPEAMPTVAPPTPEQRRQQELLVNAERIDKANRELLAKNQELQLQNENLGMQINVIRHDKSSEGIWKGALAVIAGFLLGWFFATSSRRKSSW